MEFNFQFANQNVESKYQQLFAETQARNELIKREKLNTKINKDKFFSRPSNVLESYHSSSSLSRNSKFEDDELESELTDDLSDENSQFKDDIPSNFGSRILRKLRSSRVGRPFSRVSSLNDGLSNEKENSRREEFFSSLNNFNPLKTLNYNLKSSKSARQGSINNNERIKYSEERLKFSKINVIAFVGPPGTGKSTRANKIAADRNIDFFIDDGLLIEHGRIKAGSTAKKASTKLESVKQAIFMEEVQAATMRRAIATLEIDRLMILGTSDKMIYKICENLHLPEPVEFIRIADVSTQEEQKAARNMRKTQGSHAIPVTSMEIKHEFSGSYFDPIMSFMKRLGNTDNVNPYADSDRTIVRPTFSTIGNNIISDEAMSSLIKFILKDLEGLALVQDVEIVTTAYGAILDLEISLFYGFNAPKIMSEVQCLLMEKIELYTSINILSVNVTCRSVVERRGVKL